METATIFHCYTSTWFLNLGESVFTLPESQWAELREEQLKVVISTTGMAVTIDGGEVE